LRFVKDAEGTVIAEYKYDGLTRRTVSIVSGQTRHFYYNDQWRIVEERLDNATYPERQHIWHPSDRWDLILRDRSTNHNGTLDERLYSLKDQFDPVAICNASGQIIERYAYSAFGIPTVLSPNFTSLTDNTSTIAWNFLFHGEFTDAGTNWMNYGYRYYSAELGRWLGRDPIGEEGGRNLYWMVGNKIINFIDIFGKQAFMLGSEDIDFFNPCEPDPDYVIEKSKIPELFTCCTPDQIDLGEKSLQSQAETIDGKIKDGSIEILGYTDLSKPLKGMGFCVDTSIRALDEFTIPSCWECRVEDRHTSLFPSHGWRNHAAIVCRSHDDEFNHVRTIIFDFTEGVTDIDDFRKWWPILYSAEDSHGTSVWRQPKNVK
jgi:RHS repeat-associated protein